MFWLEKAVDDIESAYPGCDEFIVSSGVSPSGMYHVGHLREVLTAHAVVRALRLKGHEARHIHVVDDLDAFRKVPFNVPEEWNQYLGMSLCDVPSFEGSATSYADYFLNSFLEAMDRLGVDLDIIRAHEKYRSGAMVDVIEKALVRIDQAKEIQEKIAGRKLAEDWNPVQVVENNRLKNRKIVSVDTTNHTLTFESGDGTPSVADMSSGEVKLDWRLDWPARWSMLGVMVEPFGREHATKGGSYDTGVELVRSIFDAQPPYPIAYNTINRTGDTTKMSSSKGNGVEIKEVINILPAEVLWYFILRYDPGKQLFFDEQGTVIQLFDEFSNLLASQDKSKEEETLVGVCLAQTADQTISNIPFSHLVSCYQASLKNSDQTIKLIQLTEHNEVATEQRAIIERELVYIDKWLESWAPDEVKFSLRDRIEASEFSEIEISFLSKLADKIDNAPDDADGEWFHKAIYEFKSEEMSPKDLFSALYRCLIAKKAGPRAGWFLSILPRDWLLKRLRLIA